eukprot:jgi/Galph1/4313/GphlegSOOS_G3010.1
MELRRFAPSSTLKTTTTALTNSEIAKLNILDRPLTRSREDINLSTFSFIFAEAVQYLQTRVQQVSELEEKLNNLGYRVGERSLELLCFRERINRRETRVVNILGFIRVNLWKFLFRKQADYLKKVTDREDEYYLEEEEPLVNRFISVPKDLGQLNCAAFMGGIIRGVLDSAGFPAAVSAHYVYNKEKNRTSIPVTIFMIRFEESVMNRERLASYVECFIGGQLVPFTCPSLQWVTVYSNTTFYNCPVTWKGTFQAIVPCSLSMSLSIEGVGCGLIYRQSLHHFSTLPVEGRVTPVIMLHPVQDIHEKESELAITKLLSNPLIWLAVIGILFLSCFPKLVDLLDDDLYEELMGEKRESLKGPFLGYRLIMEGEQSQ